MTRARSNPPAPGQHCHAKKARWGSNCYDPAVWIVFYSDKETGATKQVNACGGHLNRLCEDLTPQAEYSREMFRVIPWATAIAETRKKHDAQAADE